MIPQLVTVRVERPGRAPIRAWVPVLPVALALSPLLIVAALAALIACVVFRVDVVRAFVAGWRLVCALPGTRVDVHEGRSAVLVSIR
ncbi:hypothetical protein AB0F72_20455 [Actinoplanes sp. NPDC023936]|uniref:hypothetical protein n=1 Tax=Actinoplanes sp. NPDC023936 TaxID=3154910 RepID=UPI0034043802